MCTAESRITPYRTGSVRMLLFTALMIAAAIFAGRLDAQSAASEVGLVTRVSGEVTYLNESDQKQPAKVQAFMKVHKNDRFQVPADGLIQVVYFSDSRQETWKGRVTLAAGDGESRVQGKEDRTIQPEVKTLPTGVTRVIGGSAMPFPRSSVPTSGVVQIRGLNRRDGTPQKAPAQLTEKEQDEIKAAEATCESLRAGRDTGDITPELYLLAVLADYGRYPEMIKVIDSALKRQPENATLLNLKDWAGSRMQ